METKIKMVISYSLTTAYPLKWLKKKNLTTPSVRKDVE